MQELIDWFNENHLLLHLPIELLEKSQELLEKEREQIIDACNMGIDLESHFLINDGEQYYNETYNQNKS